MGVASEAGEVEVLEVHVWSELVVAEGELKVIS